MGKHTLFGNQMIDYTGIVKIVENHSQLKTLLKYISKFKIVWYILLQMGENMVSSKLTIDIISTEMNEALVSYHGYH